ncbi:hypothetical protein B0A53_04532 [Rhodotorula sp. CCFEE 5036]|nr:hypothetical protein B0A53_04532 [Rhodotorula sp. CCFEE 5036]
MGRGSGTTKKQFDDLRQQLAEACAAQQAAEQALAALQRSKEGGKVKTEKLEVKGDIGSSTAPPFKIGLRPTEREDPLTTISNGAGGLAVVDQLVRAVANGLIPPAACFTETHLHYIKSHKLNFLPSAHCPINDEAKRRCLQAWAPVHEAEHLMPLKRFLPAFLKLIASVQETICKDNASQKYVQEDVDHFLDELFRRLGNDGDWRIAREYALLRIQQWRSNIAKHVPWLQNFLSSWSEDFWTLAKQMAGAPKSRTVPRLESAGDTKTAWGSLTSLTYDETKQEFLKQIGDEDRKIAGAVLAGECWAGIASLACCAPLGLIFLF